MRECLGWREIGFEVLECDLEIETEVIGMDTFEVVDIPLLFILEFEKQWQSVPFEGMKVGQSISVETTISNISSNFNSLSFICFRCDIFSWKVLGM